MATEQQIESSLQEVHELKSALAEARALNAQLEARVARHTAELAAAHQELDAFSHSVSHDLRAPVRAVSGFANIVFEEFGQQLPEPARGYLERIRSSGRRINQMLDDLLRLAQLSRQPVSRQPVDMAQLVQEVLGEVILAGDGRSIEVRTGELPACLGDPALLKQVWTNLLSNGVKFTRDRNPAVIELGSERHNGQCVYFVRDNGVGFDLQYARKLFTVFQRMHREDEFEGTGVGLAIVQRVVHRHGGRVWAAAESGRGATFYFTLDGKNL